MQNVITRIRKLLALARDKGATEAEAAAAMTKAAELMLQHNIDHVDDLDAPVVGLGDTLTVDLSQQWLRLIAAAAANLYNCRFMTTPQMDVLQFVGRPLNRMAAEETFDFLCDQLQAMLRAYKPLVRKLIDTHKDESLDESFTITFLEAAALRVLHRSAEIVAHVRGTIPTHKALVVLQDDQQAIEQAMQAAGAQTKHPRQWLQLRKSDIGTGAGLAAGDAVQMQQNVQR